MIQEAKKNNQFQHIVTVALNEFGTKSYEIASMNQICKQGKVAKGSIYHYFKDKDALYLYCVKEAIDTLVATLSQKVEPFQEGAQGIQKYFSLRQSFFRAQPDLAFIFTNAILNPPSHLMEDIKKLKKSLDAFNLTYYERVLSGVRLKRGLTKEEAIEYFLIFQESFNYYFQEKASNNYQETLEEHEIKINQLLKIILYGMVEEEEDACFY